MIYIKRVLNILKIVVLILVRPKMMVNSNTIFDYDRKTINIFATVLFMIFLVFEIIPSYINSTEIIYMKPIAMAPILLALIMNGLAAFESEVMKYISDTEFDKVVYQKVIYPFNFVYVLLFTISYILVSMFCVNEVFAYLVPLILIFLYIYHRLIIIEHRYNGDDFNTFKFTLFAIPIGIVIVVYLMMMIQVFSEN